MEGVTCSQPGQGLVVLRTDQDFHHLSLTCLHVPWLEDLAWDPGSPMPDGQLSPQPADIQRHAGSMEFHLCHVTWGLGGCSKAESALPLLICLVLLAWAFYFLHIIWSFSLSLELNESLGSRPLALLLDVSKVQ